MITFRFYLFIMKHLFSFLLFTLCSIYLIAQPSNQFELAQPAPLFEVTDQFDHPIILEDVLKESKVLLVFYRGSWCPYCKKHLSMLNENLEKLNKKGTKVIVVTPEKPEYIAEMTERTAGGISIVHDQDGSIMRNYHVGFEVNEENVTKFYNLTMKNAISYNSEETSDILPVPATFIINQKGAFDYIQFDPDYKNRSTFEDIIKHL